MAELQVINPMQDNTGSGVDFMVLKFADAAIPTFKEAKHKDIVLYGEDNNYPDYLTYLFNKSAKHNAIVNGKSFYIFGRGFSNGDFVCNRLNEGLNDVIKKCVLDVELYGGFRLELVYNALGKICEIYHASYDTIRLSKESGYYYSETWDKYTKEAIPIPDFNPSLPGTQLYSYNQYRPNTKYYPLPDYIGANNYIETDIEISKYYLSAIRNGMIPSKMVQFFSGEPTEDKKKAIERRFQNKFAGSENSGRIIMVFNNNGTTPVQIDDMSATDLDKQFIELNKTCQQEIFSGHLVTSPMLFGIKTEGQLGGNTELRTAYELFNNTYAKPKAEVISQEITYLLSFSIWPGVYELEPTEPVGLQIDINSVIDKLPTSFIFDKLGIEDAVPEQPISAPGTASLPVNENIKNLSGRQQQNLDRIIRRYKKGLSNEAQTRLLIKSGLGLSDDEISTLLGIQTKMSKQHTEDEIIAMFDACGDSKDDFEIIRSKYVSFEIADSEEDEAIYIKDAFRDFTTTEAKIIALIKKDPLITPAAIAQVIGQSEALVTSKIASLTQGGYIESTEIASGVDTVISRTITETIKLPPAIIDKQPVNVISVRYSYEGPQDSRNRPFCAKLLQLNRLYTRAEIERISARLGYSVWDRRGGWYTLPGTNDHRPYCRHRWKSNLVVQKKVIS